MPKKLTHARMLHAQLIRSGISFTLCAAAAKAQGLPSLMGTRALWPLLCVRGFVGAASMTFYYEAINRMPLADVVRSWTPPLQLLRQGSLHVDVSAIAQHKQRCKPSCIRALLRAA